MRHLCLILSGLPPDAAPAALSTLLARGRPIAGEYAQSPDQRLARLFAPPDLPDLALAPIRLARDQMGALGSGWLCADPVHLRLMRDHILLGDAHAFELDAAEANALVAGLNAHFAGRVEFVAATPGRWYARFQPPLARAHEPLDKMLARPVEVRPGADAAARSLASLDNEVQMFLHAHPVNAAREARGADAINGVWFWGGGSEQPARAPAEWLLTDSAMARALAEAAGMRHAPLDATAEILRGPASSALVFSDGAHPLARYGQTSAWRDYFAGLDVSVCRPLLSALRRGRVETTVIETLGDPGAACRLGRWDAWKFWRA